MFDLRVRYYPPEKNSGQGVVYIERESGWTVDTSAQVILNNDGKDAERVFKAIKQVSGAKND